MFNWADIRVFLELARQQHLSTAAQRLRVDTSTVSRRVAELERTIKCKLFERSQEGFVLSDAGLRLLPLAESMEAAAEKIAFNVVAPEPGELNVVRVATMEGLATSVVAPAFGILRSAKPQIALELLVVHQPTNLGRREADVSITMMKLDSPRLMSEKIGEFNIGLYASEEYLEKEGIPEGESDLAKHRFIDYLEAFVPVSEVRWLCELVPEPRTVFYSNSLIAQQKAAIGGVGLVALPSYLASPDTRLVSVIPDRRVSRELWMTVHADTEYFSRIRIVSDFIRSQVGALASGKDQAQL
jgi:DNA-binding transcriptional LysR family regulator